MKLLLISFAIFVAQARVVKRSSEILFPDSDEFEAHFESRNAFDEIDPNIEMNLNLFQGDISLTGEQEEFFKALVEDEDDDLFRTGLAIEKYLWRKNEEGKVVVPYVIAEEAEFTTRQKKTIKLAMSQFTKYTCVIFKERTNETDFIEIISGAGCYSNLGRSGGKQEISFMKPNCFVFGTLIHELIHALGYDHMHSHSDRDEFVDVRYENIVQGFRRNFEKVNPKLFHNYGTPYDYMSVMHYPQTAGSKNGLDTIVPKKPFRGEAIGQRRGFSRGDIARINNMYQCKV